MIWCTCKHSQNTSFDCFKTIKKKPIRNCDKTQNLARKLYFWFLDDRLCAADSFCRFTLFLHVFCCCCDCVLFLFSFFDNNRSWNLSRMANKSQFIIERIHGTKSKRYKSRDTILNATHFLTSFFQEFPLENLFFLQNIFRIVRSNFEIL